MPLLAYRIIHEPIKFEELLIFFFQDTYNFLSKILDATFGYVPIDFFSSTPITLGIKSKNYLIAKSKEFVKFVLYLNINKLNHKKWRVFPSKIYIFF